MSSSTPTSISEALDSPSVFQNKLTIGWCGIIGCAYFIVFVLKKIELNQPSSKQKKRIKLDDRIGRDTALTVTTTNGTSSPSKSPSHNNKNSKNSASHHTAELSTSRSNDDDDNKSVATNGDSSVFESQIHDMATNPKYFEPQQDDPYQYQNSNSYGDGYGDDDDDNVRSRIIRTKLRLEEKLSLYGIVSLLLFLTYLLLVYLPSGPIASILGTFFLSVVLLKTQVMDEIRRGRYDRLAAVTTLLLYAAGCLSLVTYASIGMREGTIYEGKARIIGYDTSVYETNEGEATRMDLEVAWGGNWGCPDYNGVQCQAFVNGALCESEEDNNNTDRRSRSRTRTLLNLFHPHNRDLSKDEGDDASDSNDTDNTNADHGKDKQDQTTQETQEQKDEETIEELEAEVAELTKENEDLSNENKDLDNVITDEHSQIEKDYDTITSTAEDLEDEAEVAELYKDEVVEEEGEVVEEEAEVLEEANVAEYYANVALDEQEVIEGVYGEEEGDAIVEEIAEKAIDYYIENEEVIEEVIDESEEIIDEVQEYYEEEEDEVVDKAEEIIEDEIEDEEKIDEEVEEKTKGKGVKYDDYEDNDDEGGEMDEENYDYYYNAYNYAWDDDAFEDDWWSNSWSDVWGEYACNDLFDEDMEGQTYNANQKPGKDDWPFVNIYGSCNRCEAYLVDYYSTEHFNMIKNYEKHAKIYASVASVALLVTLVLGVKQWISPAQENELGLLMYDGGQMV